MVLEIILQETSTHLEQLFKNKTYLPLVFFDGDASVITDEITVVSWCDLYEPSGSFVHSVKAI